jgi:hypothetical protein
MAAKLRFWQQIPNPVLMSGVDNGSFDELYLQKFNDPCSKEHLLPGYFLYL